MPYLSKTANKSLHLTNLSVTPFAEQKPCQPAFSGELNRYVSSSIKPWLGKLFANQESRNIGKTVSTRLHGIGIANEAELKRLGAEKAKPIFSEGLAK